MTSAAASSSGSRGYPANAIDGIFTRCSSASRGSIAQTVRPRFVTIDGVTDVLEGAHIAGCRIESVAGRGGMGIVYRATQLSLGRPVALKLIAPEHAADASFRERFQRESRMAAAIDHPNVIPVYEAGEEDGRLYLVMRWVAGTDLHRELRAERAASHPERAALIVNQVAGALDAAHAAGLVHRDVKPAQRPAQRRARVPGGLRADALRRHRHAMTTGGHFLGTVDYMAPEQFHPGPERRARGRLRARLRAVRGADRRAAVPARHGAGDDDRAPARPAAAGVGHAGRAARASTACSRGRWPRRRRIATRRRVTSGARCWPRPRGARSPRRSARWRAGPRRRRRAGASGRRRSPSRRPRRRPPVKTYRSRGRPRWLFLGGAGVLAAARGRVRAVPGRRRRRRAARLAGHGGRGRAARATRSPPPTRTRTRRGSRAC